MDADFEEISQLLSRLITLVGGVESVKLLEKAGGVAGAYAEGLVREYPSPSRRPLPVYYTRRRKDGSTFKSKFKSERQQRYFFWALTQGKIPYKRTGQLGRSITHVVEVSTENNVIEIVVGTNLEYAPFVIGEEQSHYHQETGWKQLPEELTRAADDIRAVFVTTFVEGYEDALKSH